MIDLDAIARQRSADQLAAVDMTEPKLPLAPCPCGKPSKAQGLCMSCYGKRWRAEQNDPTARWWKALVAAVPTLDEDAICSLIAEAEALIETARDALRARAA